jgi:hypothetical protein
MATLRSTSPPSSRPAPNTLDVIQGVTRAVAEVTGLPSGMKVSTLFSQEGTILEALHALEHEASSGALLASSMILVFFSAACDPLLPSSCRFPCQFWPASLACRCPIKPSTL